MTPWLPGTRYYVTLFDSNYVDKAVALYRSMERHAGDFKLLVLGMDDDAIPLFRRGISPARDNVVFASKGLVCHLDFARSDRLMAACHDRSVGETCWTYTPQALLLALHEFKHAERVTYLDADSYFFDSPEPVFTEMADAPIAIPPHRFPAEKEHLHATNGIYNVNWVSFTRATEALACLDRWASDCIDWCYGADGKPGAATTGPGGRPGLGDQLYWNGYASVWPVHAVRNIGLNLAPWNMKRWPIGLNQQVETDPRAIRCPGTVFVGDQPVVLFHFHEFHWGDGSEPERLTNYTLPNETRRLIYEPYVAELRAIRKELGLSC